VPAYAGTHFIIARDGRLLPSISFSTSCSELNSAGAVRIVLVYFHGKLDFIPVDMKTQ
jgi:hypothetical protein